MSAWHAIGMERLRVCLLDGIYGVRMVVPSRRSWDAIWCAKMELYVKKENIAYDECTGPMCVVSMINTSTPRTACSNLL